MGGFVRNIYKGYMAIAKGGYDQGWEVTIVGVELSVGGKMQKTVLEKQF